MAKKIKSGISPKKAQLIIVLIAGVLVGAVGTYMITKSSAAVISGTADNCGSYYGDGEWSTPYVKNEVYKGGLKNSDSVRNLSKNLCQKGYLSSQSALKIQRNGSWSQELSKSITSFEKSDARLAASADGLPDAAMVCALTEYLFTDAGTTYATYGWPYPLGFANNDCYNLLGTTKYPYGK